MTIETKKERERRLRSALGVTRGAEIMIGTIVVLYPLAVVVALCKRWFAP